MRRSVESKTAACCSAVSERLSDIVGTCLCGREAGKLRIGSIPNLLWRQAAHWMQSTHSAQPPWFFGAGAFAGACVGQRYPRPKNDTKFRNDLPKLCG